MKTVCQINQCTGCGMCINICPHEAIKIVDTMKEINAVIDTKRCVDCGLCERACPNNDAVSLRSQLGWKQGWTENKSLRNRASSGGAASAMMAAFIDNGGYVCSCLFEKGDFVFRCTNSKEDLKLFAGSKYVKSNPGYIYREVKKLLADGEKVLFIALPCQVAAMYRFVPERFWENLYTVDLICHGTPSKKLLEYYLRQNGVEMDKLSGISFRQKAAMGLDLKEKSFTPKGVVDRYLISFLNSINYVEHCYSCQYATQDRVSDVTLGDSWGSTMTSELSKGLSLITTQSEKGEQLLAMSNLTLHEVDVDNALAHNGNMMHPSKAPDSRDAFFEGIAAGKNYNKLVKKAFPKQCTRQSVKAVAIKLRLINPRGGIE